MLHEVVKRLKQEKWMCYDLFNQRPVVSGYGVSVRGVGKVYVYNPSRIKGQIASFVEKHYTILTEWTPRAYLVMRIVDDSFLINVAVVVGTENGAVEYSKATESVPYDIHTGSVIS